ncbi:MAG: recombinase family protein [Planctomycetaceae bacterium]
MARTKTRTTASGTPTTRCAIYTRKSTEDGLEQEFNSLHAQRLAGENYVRSQVAEGWEIIVDDYDDGGFTGANMDRPALGRLMADIEAGKIDCCVVYKVDRLSRSLLDFSRILEKFDKHNVAFVSVTQQFNTANSMGRLMLNVLLSFAQFEREIISERTRDKIAAARRKGKWVGGMPLLGYDIDPRGSKLVINNDEANRVRSIFDLYLEDRSLIAVIRVLDDRGWSGKRWVTKKQIERGGKPFTKTSLHKLLTNITYLGKVRYKEEIHDGEHAAIVDPDVWQQVQSLLQRNGRSGGIETRNKFGALLKGLLRCVACDSAMTPTHATKKGNKRYRYYVCCHAQKRGWHNCPFPSIPAMEIEKFVVDQIRRIGRDPDLIRETVTQARGQAQSQLAALGAEQASLERELGLWNGEIRDVVAHVGPDDADSPAVARLADLQERTRRAERRATEIREQMRAINARAVDQNEVATAMAKFDPVWNALTPREQCRVIELLVARVDYDGRRGKVAITFHPDGVRNFGADSNPTEDAA